MHGFMLLAAADRHTLPDTVPATRVVEWVLAAPETPRRCQRAPLNLALVLDRSGSMQGAKLFYAQRAACYLLDQLDAGDHVALVAFDDEVTLLSPRVPATESQREALKAAVRTLTEGGCTDLAGGWEAGMQQLVAGGRLDGITRVLLLTDGLANRGQTDTEALIHQAQQWREKGISTSTFGVGLDFNEYLLEAAAVAGGGHFYFVERPEQLPDIFRDEVGEMLTMVAREAVLTITVPAGVAVEVLGGSVYEQHDDRVRIFLGEFGAGERRVIYTRLLTPPAPTGTALRFSAQLVYAAPHGEGGGTLLAEQSFRYAPAAEVAQTTVEEGVLRRAGEVEIAAATARALPLEREGDRRQAQRVMRQSMADVVPYLSDAAREAYTELMDGVGRGLTERERKAEHFAAYRKRLDRTPPGDEVNG